METLETSYLSPAPFTHTIRIHSHMISRCTLTTLVASVGITLVAITLVVLCLYICLQGSLTRR